MGMPNYVYAGDDNVLQNVEKLLFAGKKLNKLRMFSHQRHKGQNHKERYKKAILNCDQLQMFGNNTHKSKEQARKN